MKKLLTASVMISSCIRNYIFFIECYLNLNKRQMQAKLQTNFVRSSFNPNLIATLVVPLNSILKQSDSFRKRNINKLEQMLRSYEGISIFDN